MSDTASALRAAREVQADTLAPEIYREASEWWLKARREYKFKNFSYAKEYATKARSLAEQAEFEALRNGGNRADTVPDPLASATPEAGPPQANATPTPQGTPAEDYEAARARDQAEKKDDVNKAPNVSQQGTTTNQTYAPYPSQGGAPNTSATPVPGGGAAPTTPGAGTPGTGTGLTVPGTGTR